MSIGSKLKDIRKQKQLTQKEVAGALHISKPILSQYESDDRTPSLDRLICLSRYYGVPMDSICEDVKIKDGRIVK